MLLGAESFGVTGVVQLLRKFLPRANGTVQAKQLHQVDDRSLPIELFRGLGGHTLLSTPLARRVAQIADLVMIALSAIGLRLLVRPVIATPPVQERQLAQKAQAVLELRPNYPLPSQPNSRIDELLPHNWHPAR